MENDTEQEQSLEENFKNQFVIKHEDKKTNAFMMLWEQLMKYVSSNKIGISTSSKSLSQEEMAKIYLQEQEIINKKNELYNKVNGLIDGGVLTLVIEMKTNGYELDSRQLRSFNDALLKDLLQGNNEALKKMIEESQEIENKVLVKWLLRNDDPKEVIKFLQENLEYKLHDEDFNQGVLEYILKETSKTFQNIKEELKSYKSYHDKQKLFGNVLDYMAQVNIVVYDYFPYIESCNCLEAYTKLYNYSNQYVKMIESLAQTGEQFKLLESFKSTLKQMNVHMNIKFVNDKNKLIEDVRMVSMEKALDNRVLKNNLSRLNQSALEQLSEEAKNLVKEINSKVRECYKNKESIGLEKNTIVENLYDKTIPSVIANYTSLTIEDRKTLRNIDNKTPEQLMLESLNNIKTTINNILEEKTQDTVNNLSVTNRYTQNIKNSLK